MVRPRGFTSREYADRYGLTVSVASSRLKRMAEDGKLIVTGTWIVDGHTSKVYDVVGGK